MKLSERPDHSALLNFILSWLFIAFTLAFLLLITVLTRYDQGAVIVLGVLVGAIAIVTTWQTKRKILRFIIVLILSLILSISGLVFLKAANYRSEVNTLVAQWTLSSVGKALENYSKINGELPDCDFRCMSFVLQSENLWQPIEIPFENSDRSVNFDSIPIKDEWGCRYGYEIYGDNHFWLKSSGVDCRYGTKDDVEYRSDAPISDQLPFLPVFDK